MNSRGSLPSVFLVVARLDQTVMSLVVYDVLLSE